VGVAQSMAILSTNGISLLFKHLAKWINGYWSIWRKRQDHFL